MKAQNQIDRSFHMKDFLSTIERTRQILKEIDNSLGQEMNASQSTFFDSTEESSMPPREVFQEKPTYSEGKHKVGTHSIDFTNQRDPINGFIMSELLVNQFP